jgi:hypothetical protein
MSAHNMSAKNISHFKKRPLAQIMAVAFSLTVGSVSNSAFAAVSPLPCDITGSLKVLLIKQLDP